MKFNKLILATAIASATLLSACSINIGSEEAGYNSHAAALKQEKRNRDAIATLVPGDTVSAVIARMGTADFSEFANIDGKARTVLYYRTQRVHGDGHTTKDECTPIVFIDGKVVGWGQSAL